MDGRYSKRSATNVLGYAKKRSQDLYIVKMERKIHDSIDVTSADVVMSLYFFPNTLGYAGQQSASLYEFCLFTFGAQLNLQRAKLEKHGKHVSGRLDRIPCFG